MPKLHRLPPHPDRETLAFLCPRCNEPHLANIRAPFGCPIYRWNHSMDAPSFWPMFEYRDCKIFITEGVAVLEDGRKIELSEWEG